MISSRILLDSLIHIKSNSNYAIAAIVYVSNDNLQVFRSLQINLIENCKSPYTQNAYQHPKTTEGIENEQPSATESFSPADRQEKLVTQLTQIL